MKWLKKLALSFVKGLIKEHVEKLELLEPKIVKLLKKNRVGSDTSRPQVADAIVELAKEEIIKLINRI